MVLFSFLCFRNSYFFHKNILFIHITYSYTYFKIKHFLKFLRINFYYGKYSQLKHIIGVLKSKSKKGSGYQKV